MKKLTIKQRKELVRLIHAYLLINPSAEMFDDCDMEEDEKTTILNDIKKSGYGVFRNEEISNFGRVEELVKYVRDTFSNNLKSPNPQKAKNDV